ncbi:hypothetical protein ACQ4PT_035612 [Festuca glaucescens]
MADQSLTPYPLQSGGVQSQRRAARRRGDRRGSTQGLLDPHQDHLHLPLPHRPHLLACQGRLCDTTTVSKDLGPRGIRGGGEHRGTRRGVRGGRYGGADVPGSVRHLLQLRVRGEQHVLLGAVPFAVSPGMRRDGTTRFRDAQGEPLHDFLAVSSFSQYTVVDVNQAVKVHPAVPPKLACLLSCGAGTGVGAAWRLAKVEPGSSVVIFGLGAVGLAVAQGAKMCGATKIVGVDLNPAKQELGKMFGLTDFVNPSELGESSVIEVITRMTDGGADYCFECIGVASVMIDAFRSAKQGTGKTVILGVEKDGKPICLPSIEFLFGKCVMGSLFGGIKPKTDIPIHAEKCMNKVIFLSLHDINTAFDLLVHGKSLRCIIWMDKLGV